jgi:hypothetical protein
MLRELGCRLRLDSSALGTLLQRRKASGRSSVAETALIDG